MGPSLRAKLIGIWRRPVFWLAIMVTVFFVLSSYTGLSAYDSFDTHNSTSAGSLTQAVSSTTFGPRAPFYEPGDCLGSGRCSYMLVHTDFMLYTAVPFYAWVPSTVTLLTWQSFFVAIAAVPLYWLTRQVTNSGGKSLFAAGLYLVSAPMFAAEAFSLNPECLMPAEMIGIAALWQAGRYRWGLALAVVSFLTFEDAPIFVFLIGVFFLLPDAYRWLRGLWTRFRMRHAPPGPGDLPRKSWLAEILSPVRIREVRWGLVLLAVSVLSFLALLSFMNVWGHWALGVVPPPVPPGVSGFFYITGRFPLSPLSVVLHSHHTVQAAEYWLIMFGLVGFLPFLAPRTLVLTAPWVLYTFLTSTANQYVQFANQTTELAIGGMFIGVAYGLARLPWAGPKGSASSAAAPAEPAPPQTNRSRLHRPSRRTLAKATIVTVLAVVVAGNVVLSPLNPMLPDHGFQPSSLFPGNYFYRDFALSPGIQWAEELLSNVPRDASIAAASALYPLVGNYPYATVILPGVQPYQNPGPISRLPFNLNHGPEFAFFQQSELAKPSGATIEPDFAQNLTNPTVYGLRGYTGSTAAGSILLFEQNYSSQVSAYGPSPKFSTSGPSYWPGNGLVAGPLGRNVTNASALKHAMIRSLPDNTLTGVVWAASSLFFVAGNYSLRMEVSANGTGLGADPTASVFTLLVQGNGNVLLQKSYVASNFTSGKWTNLTVTFQAADPIPELTLEGILTDPSVSIAAAYVTIHANASK